LKKSLLFTALFSAICQVLTAQVTVRGQLTENRIEPIGLGTIHPRFTREIVSGDRNVMQSAYEIRVSDKD
jgi:alpha-L-rhamnosidase